LPRTLGEIALDAGLVNKADAARAGRLADERHEPLIVVLVRELGVDEVALLAAVRRHTRTPFADPASVRPDAEALRLLPADLCKRLRVLPLSLVTDGVGGRIVRVAMADPTDASAIAEVEHTCGSELEVAILPLSAIEELTEQGYRGDPTGVLRARRRFGEGVVPTTALHARGNLEETTEVPATQPFHALIDEADVGLRHRALVGLLVAKGVITEDEYDEAVRDLLRRRDEEP
jgi:hypothetical protein